MLKSQSIEGDAVVGLVVMLLRTQLMDIALLTSSMLSWAGVFAFSNLPPELRHRLEIPQQRLNDLSAVAHTCSHCSGFARITEDGE